MTTYRRQAPRRGTSFQTVRVGALFWLWTCLPSMAASCDRANGPTEDIIVESFAAAGAPLKTYLVVDTTDTPHTVIDTVTVEAEGIAGAGTLTIREPGDPVGVTYTFDVPRLDSGETGVPGDRTRSQLLYSYWAPDRDVSASHTVVFELLLESDGYAAVELHLGTNSRPDSCISDMGQSTTLTLELTDDIGGDSGEP